MCQIEGCERIELGRDARGWSYVLLRCVTRPPVIECRRGLVTWIQFAAAWLAGGDAPEPIRDKVLAMTAA